MKKYISIMLVILLVLVLIPIQAFAVRGTQVHVKNVPSGVTEVYVNFSDGNSLSCAKNGNIWKTPDAGTYVSDDITGVTIVHFLV